MTLELKDIWSDPWWQKHQWRSQINISDNEFNERIDFLKSVFNRDWQKSLQEDAYSHPLIQSVCLDESLFNIRGLLELADQLRVLKDVTGFAKVLKNYKSIKQARSAQLEMFMAWVMRRDGYSVEFINAKPKKGKTPDILVNQDSEYSFVVECKHLEDAAAERWIETYRFNFFQQLHNASKHGISLYYRHYGDLEIRDYGHPEELVSPVLAAIVDTLPMISAIEKLRVNGAIPGFTQIAGKGEVGLFHEADGMLSEMIIPELNQRQLMSRLFGRGVKQAATQINEYGRPGIAAIFQAQPAAYNVIENRFKGLVEADPELYRKLMGILIFPAQNILHYVQPLWVPNPHSELDPANVGIPEMVARCFDL